MRYEIVASACLMGRRNVDRVLAASDELRYADAIAKMLQEKFIVRNNTVAIKDTATGQWIRFQYAR
jgi:hypothetical protein